MHLTLSFFLLSSRNSTVCSTRLQACIKSTQKSSPGPSTSNSLHLSPYYFTPSFSLLFHSIFLLTISPHYFTPSLTSLFHSITSLFHSTPSLTSLFHSIFPLTILHNVQTQCSLLKNSEHKSINKMQKKLTAYRSTYQHNHTDPSPRINFLKNDFS